MKKIICSVILGIFLISFISAGMTLFPNPGVKNRQYEYTFNFTENYDCSGVLLSYNTFLTTNDRGFAFVDIPLTTLTSTPSYLCEYRGFSGDPIAYRTTHNFSDVIFKSIRVVDDILVGRDVNATTFNGLWNGSVNYALVNEPLWTANWTVYNATWSSTTNSSYVPYTGATSDVDIGSYDFLTTGNISANEFQINGVRLNSTHIIDHDGHSIKDTFNHIINRGVAKKITVSLTGGLNVEWTAGEVYDASIENFVATDAGSGTLVNNQVNYLKYTGTSTLELATSSSSGDEILIARFATINGMIAGNREISLLDNLLSDTSRGLRIAFPNRIISGMSVSEDTDATNDLDVSMDAGKIVKDGINEVNPPAIDSRTLNLVRLFHSGGSWTNDSNAEIDTIQYDNGNDLTNIPSNKWVKAYFIYIQGKLGWVYPTTYYNNKAEAEASSLSPMPPGLTLAPKLTTVIYQQGDTDFSNAKWQDVRPGISEESFNIVTNIGDLAGLSDDNFPQYLLTDGSRALTGNWDAGSYNITADYFKGDGSELTGNQTLGQKITFA
ncbi:MAG: hypothetical protein J7L15_03550, partial [Clostridiales bacterium]|nr:hypothetical protein [Clostridiales bacterium]